FPVDCPLKGRCRIWRLAQRKTTDVVGGRIQSTNERKNHMKSRLTWILCCSACVLSATSFAQDSDGSPRPQAGRYDTNQPSATTTTDRDETRSKEFCRSKDLVGANVKDSQGQKLGEI